MTAGFWAYGSILQMGDGNSPEVFAAIAEITEGPDGSDMSRDKIDMTNHQSADGFKESIPGFHDAGTLSGKCNWLPNDATHDENTGLLAHFNQNTKRNWKLILPSSAGTFSFSGYLTKFKPNLDPDKQGSIEFEITISGKPAFA
jgi:predicted secreted protein